MTWLFWLSAILPPTPCCPSSLLSSFSFTWSSSSSSMIWETSTLRTLANWGPWHPCRVRPSHRLWAQRRAEREDAASRRHAYQSPDEGLSSSQSSSVGHRTGRLVGDQFDSLISNVKENPPRSSENEQIRIVLERQREQILADCQAEIRKHEFQADYDRRSIQKLNQVIEFQWGEIYRAHQGDEQLRRDQQLLHEQLLEQNRDP